MHEVLALIIDDETLAIETLRWQLKKFCPFVRVVASFNNPLKALSFLEHERIDLCFLDIDMPEMSGFDFLNHWPAAPPFNVIFTTAYSEFAVRAFRVSAFDYLLKPVDEEELISTLTRFRQQPASNQLADQLLLLADQLNQPTAFADRLALPTQEGIHFIDTNLIVRLAANGNYTTIHLEDKTELLLSKNLRQLEELLDPGKFIRIHQTHAVSLRRIKLYQRGRGGSVILESGERLPVSKQRKPSLLAALGLAE